MTQLLAGLLGLVLLRLSLEVLVESNQASSSAYFRISLASCDQDGQKALGSQRESTHSAQVESDYDHQALCHHPAHIARP